MHATTHGGKDGKMRRTVLCGRCVVGVYSLLPLVFLVRAVVGSLCFLAVYSVWTQSTAIVSNISVYLLRICRNAGSDCAGSIPASTFVHV